MLVRERMTSPAVTITPETPFQEALKLMRDKKFRRLPVVDSAGKIVGIVSERDMLHASPSPATSLSVWEVNYLLWKLKISDIMTHNVLTIDQESPHRRRGQPDGVRTRSAACRLSMTTTSGRSA
jgi:acetoin utilization protein AcuB